MLPGAIIPVRVGKIRRKIKISVEKSQKEREKLVSKTFLLRLLSVVENKKKCFVML